MSEYRTKESCMSVDLTVTEFVNFNPNKNQQQQVRRPVFKDTLHTSA